MTVALLGYRWNVTTEKGNENGGNKFIKSGYESQLGFSISAAPTGYVHIVLAVIKLTLL